ncbi:MAG: sugar phosphate isomerase/epimerase [Lentisphaerae bacterium]|nr:sugar phosphate isomerase/epimerase [Lentisphaerota bacterium]
MEKHLHYYYRWQKLSREDFYRTMREFVDNSCRYFVITDEMLKNMLLDPDQVKFLKGVCKDMQVEFSAVHGLDGRGFDMNTVDPDRRQGMVNDHIKAMNIAAEFKCRSYVVHVGAAHYCYDRISLDILRDLALKTLELLLPEAEKLNMVIAVENSFEKPNSAKEVMKLINHFGNHPNMGACYDTGHAHCMASAPGKTLDKYEPYFAKCWWENGVEQEDDALETMQSQVVTCHIHDNTGYGDLHGMPFDGTINWAELIPKLKNCPRMESYQTEVTMDYGDNWAGRLLAPVGGYSIRKLADTFRKLGF